MTSMEKGIEFSDDSESISGEALSIKEIILRQIRKIGDISCKEFTAGYWEKKPIKTGGGIMITKTYHEDIRQAYCNAVDFLIDITYPMGDKELKKYLEDFEGFENKIKKDDEEKKKDDEEKKKEDEEKKNDDEEIKIAEKLKLKRQTFRQINIMFESNNFWKGQGAYNE